MSGSSFPDYMRIPYPEVAPEFKDAASEIGQSFFFLTHYETEFRHALSLFDFSAEREAETSQAISKHVESDHSNRPADIEPWWRTMSSLNEQHQMFSTWRFMAAREAIFALFHFRKETQSLNANMKKIPEYSTAEIRKRVGKAHSMLEKYFSQIESLRKPAAHFAEFMREKERKEHALTPRKTTMMGNLDGRTYSFNFKHKLLSLEISEKTLSQLREVRLAFYTVFGSLKPDPLEEVRQHHP